MGRVLTNLGYFWTRPSNDGCIFNASGVHCEQAGRREFDSSRVEWVLFDPQLYLTCLDRNDAGKTCAKLATYPWFNTNVPTYSSLEGTQAEWFEKVRDSFAWPPEVPEGYDDIRDAVRKCLEFQKAFGVTHLIAPAPLAHDAEDQFSTQLKWLEAGLEEGSYDAPLLATVALQDHLLSCQEPESNITLQAILDYLTASEYDGAYLVVLSDAPSSMRLTDRRIVKSLLYVCYITGTQYGKEVVVNFADDLGYACVATGATAFCTGYNVKQRRCCPSDYAEEDGAWGPFPRFYSHSLIGDFLAHTDLLKIREVRLLRLVRGDTTGSSRALIEALESGNDSTSVPAWRPTRNNVADAGLHRTALLQRVTHSLTEVEEQVQRHQRILEWLEEAEAHKALIESKLADNPLTEDFRHIRVWREAFEGFLELVEEGSI